MLNKVIPKFYMIYAAAIFAYFSLAAVSIALAVKKDEWLFVVLGVLFLVNACIWIITCFKYKQYVDMCSNHPNKLK